MQRTYRRVSFEQRCQIAALKENEIAVGRIAEQLGLNRATVYRELKRNGLPGRIYEPNTADEFAQWRRLKFCRRPRIGLSDFIERALRAGLSPEQVAGRFETVSHQTIYNEIRRHRRELACLLRRYGKRRGMGRGGRRPHRDKPAWMVPISKRPAAVEAREELGHWERDTMHLKDRRMLLVCLERKSRFVRIEKVKNHKVLRGVAAQTERLMRVGSQKPLTVTNDNGQEFMQGHLMRTPVFYCDPYSPHQRGSIENIIGVLRADFSRQADLRKFTNRQIEAVQNKLNHRPRKCLGFRTPYEVFHGKKVALAF